MNGGKGWARETQSKGEDPESEGAWECHSEEIKKLVVEARGNSDGNG